MGLLEQGGGAGTTGEGDHQHRNGLAGGGEGGGELLGTVEQLTVANGAGAAAMALPIGGDGGDGPTELIGGAGDQLIRATGSAMEQLQNRKGSDGLEESRSDLIEGSGEITTTTGDDHPGSS